MSKELEPNATLSHYRIVRKIGAGGMGEVYLAEDTKLERQVAIKFLNQEYAQDADKLRRFVQEAKAASALNHPNILTVYEIGETDDANYIATEFIEGKTLREHLAAKEPLPLANILKTGAQVAEALAAAHQAGIIHRDIKPENIMLREDGYAKVLDFGLAKLTEKKKPERVSLEGETRELVNTNPGVVMGTVAYMSPEQARGMETDARTDLWSLGVVLYEMLAGRMPFAGETVNHTIVSILEKEPVLLENAPDEMRRIVRKALTKDREMRYQTARDLLIDLKNLRRTLDIQDELERSVIPDKAATVEAEGEKATQIYAVGATATTQGEGETVRTQTASGAVSSLEYAVTQAKRHKLATGIIGIALLGIISVALYFGLLAKPNAKQIESIAVLPFENRSGNADSEYLSDGLAESLIYRLSQLPDLKVSPTSSVFRYKGKETDPQVIAKELGVDSVMTGRITQRDDNLTISVNLVDTRNGKSLWGEQYERKLSELLTTQREIVTEITNKLQLKLSGETEQKLAKKYTDNNEAHRLYLQGRFFWNKRGRQNLNKAIEYFEQSIALDSNFALAYTGLADAYSSAELGDNSKPREYALKALSLDNNLAEAHTSLGTALLRYNYDFAGAERAYKRAIELNPNYATAYQNYCRMLDALGRHAEADAEIRRALELEPLSLSINWFYGIHLYVVRDYEASIRQLKKTVELDPDFVRAQVSLADVLILNKMYAEAIEQMAKEQELEGRPANAAFIREKCAKVGWQQCWRIMTVENSPLELAPYTLARLFAELGEKDKAFANLEKAFQTRQAPFLRLKVDPRLDALRDDPRYKDLLKRMNLPE